MQSGKVSNFFSKVVPDKNDLELAAREATFSYHTVIHNHSFRSMTCTSDLIRQTLNDKKFTCAKTKTKEIIVNVISPYIIDNMIKELHSAKFISVLVDGSNHKAIKLVPILVRYFLPEIGIKNKILEFSNLPGETSDLITGKIIDVLTKYGLKEKIVALSADNTNTNFGGLARKGINNVHTKVQAELKKSIIGLGCCAHVLHNAIQCAADSLPIDVEAITVKLFGYFHISTVRVEKLKEFCEFADVQYQDILAHTKTRWLSLSPAVDRIILMFDGLKSYFLSQDSSPKLLVDFFKNDKSLLYLKFVQSMLRVFHNYIQKIEGEHIFAFELIDILSNLINNLKNRKNEHFINSEMESMINTLEEEGYSVKKEFDTNSQIFLDLCIKYIQKWTVPNQTLLVELNWLTLTKKDIVTWQNAKNTLNAISKYVSVNEDNYFDEFMAFLNIFQEKFDDWTKNSTSLEQKWIQIFKIFKEKDVSISNLAAVVEFAFCLPGSNASIERVFSLMTTTWTDVRNQLDMKTVESCLITKTYGLSCMEFHSEILKNHSFLKNVHSTKKYTMAKTEEQS